MPQNKIKKTIFLLFCTLSPIRRRLMIWLGTNFQAQMLGATSCLLAGVYVAFWGVQKPQNNKKKQFSCFGLFLLYEWAY
jgi:hypothetical protein